MTGPEDSTEPEQSTPPSTTGESQTGQAGHLEIDSQRVSLTPKGKDALAAALTGGAGENLNPQQAKSLGRSREAARRIRDLNKR